MLLLNRGGLKSGFDFLKLFKMKKLYLTYMYIHVNIDVQMYICVFIVFNWH